MNILIIVIIAVLCTALGLFLCIARWCMFYDLFSGYFDDHDDEDPYHEQGRQLNPMRATTD